MTVAEDRRLLITGAAGFVGRRMTSVVREHWPYAELILADQAAAVQGLQGGVALDVADRAAVHALVSEVRPTSIIHLAAVSAISSAVADSDKTWQINALGPFNIVMSLLENALDCHLIFVSSAEVYGKTAMLGDPVSETSLLQPANPYASAKAAADLLIQEATGRGLFATVMRPFNHTGPGQSDAFAVPSFCHQIARIEHGLQEPWIKVGALDDQRDFLDVDDVVDLYFKVLERRRDLPNGLVLNVASGVPHTIRDVLNTLTRASQADISIEIDSSRLRGTPIPRIVGDATRAREVMNWKPSRPFTQTLLTTLEYWRQRVSEA